MAGRLAIAYLRQRGCGSARVCSWGFCAVYASEDQSSQFRAGSEYVFAGAVDVCQLIDKSIVSAQKVTAPHQMLLTFATLHFLCLPLGMLDGGPA